MFGIDGKPGVDNGVRLPKAAWPAAVKNVKECETKCRQRKDCHIFIYQCPLIVGECYMYKSGDVVKDPSNPDIFGFAARCP